MWGEIFELYLSLNESINLWWRFSSKQIIDHHQLDLNAQMQNNHTQTPQVYVEKPLFKEKRKKSRKKEISL